MLANETSTIRHRAGNMRQPINSGHCADFTLSYRVVMETLTELFLTITPLVMGAAFFGTLILLLIGV